MKYEILGIICPTCNTYSEIKIDTIDKMKKGEKIGQLQFYCPNCRHDQDGEETAILRNIATNVIKLQSKEKPLRFMLLEKSLFDKYQEIRR